MEASLKIFFEGCGVRQQKLAFTVPAAESGDAFVPYIGNGLADILSEHHSIKESVLSRHLLRLGTK